MKNKRLLFATAILMTATACHKQSLTEASDEDPVPVNIRAAGDAKLLFKTDFGSNPVIVTHPVAAQSDSITGTNASVPGYPWNTSVGGFADASKIYYESGTTADRKAYIVNDDNSSNPIMKFSISDAKEPISFGTYRFKQRIQYDLYEYKDTASGNSGQSMKEFYNRVKIKLNYTSFKRLLDDTNRLKPISQSGDWVTLFECFNGIDVSFSDLSKAYRVGIGLEKTDDKKHFIIKVSGQSGQAGSNPWVPGSADPNWELKDQNFHITPGVWYTYEIYIKEGTKNNTGRVWFKITNQSTNQALVMGSTTAAVNTQNTADVTSNGFKYINPLKLYISGDVIKTVNPRLSNPAATAIPLQVYFDDWAFYSKFPY